MTGNRWREVSDMGFEDGWNATMSEVHKVICELHAADRPDLADAVHEMVWRRLRDQLDVALAARKEKRAVRDRRAAEIAARAAKQS
jgi:hypothetical protein